MFRLFLLTVVLSVLPLALPAQDLELRAVPSPEDQQQESGAAAPAEPAAVSHDAVAPQEKGNESNGEATSTYREDAPKTNWTILLNVLFTFVVAAATTVLAIVSCKQWRGLRDQVAQMVAQGKQTDRMIEMDQRAWIAVSINAMAGNFVTGSKEFKPDSMITVRNEGKTPAVITHSFVGLECSRQNLAYIEQRARSQQETRSCVAPEDILTFDIRSYGPIPPLSKVQCDNIRDGSAPAYLIGAFIYRDVFEKERKTVCSFKFDSATKQFPAYMEDGEMT